MFILAPNLLFFLAILGSGLLDPTPIATTVFAILFAAGLWRTYWLGRSISKLQESVLAVAAVGLSYAYTVVIGEFYLYAFRYWLAAMLVIRSFRRMGKREYADGFLISAGILAHVGKSYNDLPFLYVMLANVFLLPYALFYYMAHYGGFQKTGPMDTTRAPRLSLAQFRFMTGVSLVLTFVITLVFLAIPRPQGASLLGTAGEDPNARTGFSRDVALGSFNRITEQQNVVMTVETDTPALWRGSAPDFYSHGKWQESVQTDTPGPDGNTTPADVEPVLTRRFEIFDMTVLNNQIFSAGNVFSAKEINNRWNIRMKPIYSTMFVDMTRRTPQKGTYDLVSSGGPFIGQKELGKRHAKLWNGNAVQEIDERDLFLQLPVDLSERVRNLALSLTGDKPTVEAKVRAVQQYLNEGYVYSLSDLSSGASSPIEYFLFEARSGHCEYFASAMTILLRCAGVPSRVVQGFTPGTALEGRYIVRLSDAHMWCEAFYPGKGWGTHDPSPGAAERVDVAKRANVIERTKLKWYTHVLRYDGAARTDLMTGLTAAAQNAFARSAAAVARTAAPLRMGMGAALLLLVIHRLGLFKAMDLSSWFLRGEKKKAQRVRNYFGRYLKEIAIRGYKRDPGTTPNDLILALTRDNEPIVAEAQFLTDLFYGTRFGGRCPAADSEDQIKRALKAIRGWAR